MHAQEITPYFPGLVVRATSSFVFRNAKWLKGSWKGGRNEGTVVSVDAAEIRVAWLASGKAGALSCRRCARPRPPPSRTLAISPPTLMPPRRPRPA